MDSRDLFLAFSRNFRITPETISPRLVISFISIPRNSVCIVVTHSN